MSDWKATTDLDETEKLVVEFAEAMTTTPTSIDDDLRDRINAQFSEKQVVELANFISWENSRARFNRAFDLQPDGYSEQNAP